MDLNSLYLRWSSVLFVIMSRFLSFSVIYIRIPTQLILSSYYLSVLYKILEVNRGTIKYYEDLQYCITGIIWACFFILDMFRTIIDKDLYIVIPIDLIYLSILIYTIFCKEDHLRYYYGFLLFLLIAFLFQTDHKQSIVFVIMRDVFFYACYHLCLYVFDMNGGILTERIQDIITILMKSIICSVWILFYFFSQYYFPIYILLVGSRIAYFTITQKDHSLLPTTTTLVPTETPNDTKVDIPIQPPKSVDTQVVQPQVPPSQIKYKTKSSNRKNKIKGH